VGIPIATILKSRSFSEEDVVAIEAAPSLTTHAPPVQLTDAAVKQASMKLFSGPYRENRMTWKCWK